MIKITKYLTLVTLALAPIVSNAEITPEQANRFLTIQPPMAMKNTLPKQYRDLESMAKVMFFSDQKENAEQGYKNYLVMKNKADMNNPYAAYNVGVYQAIHQSKLKFDYKTTLLYLKKGADGGVDESKYALALIYANKSDEVSKIINTGSRLQGESFSAEVERNGRQLRELSHQYILELAKKGHERAFLMACNYYVRGEYLEKSIEKAALCYNNAINVFDSGVARGLLAKIYFDSGYFNSIEFEKLGIELSKKAVEQNNVYAMVNLGKQLIHPRYASNSNIETGRLLLQGAAAHGDKVALDFLIKNFDDEGRLKQPLVKN